eukprot:GHUV01028315.1.p1 GENE.GHUV01028315.1~~GHUV01028315.1.p1  ORF type:complete len:534 (-),score=150.31 GHUV01028315.1:461-2062(-)
MFHCFLPERLENLGYGYKSVRLLGKGAAGSVWLAKASDAKECVAVKTCQTLCPFWQTQMCQRECETFCRTSWGAHPNLIRPCEVRLTPNHVQLVLQHCSGGTLEDYCKHHQITEDLACYFFHQLVSVLEHLHTSRIAYRDMKLENVLLSSRPVAGQPPRLVLCDLGTAKYWKKGAQPSRCGTFVGTPGFMSPQVLASMFNTMGPHSHHTTACDDDSSHHSSTSRSSFSYDARKADIWAVGALLHYMLHQQLPYGYDSFAPLLPPAEALMTLYQLEHERTWKDALGPRGLKHISAEAQDLLDQLLHPDEDQRISIKQIKEHPWFNRPLPAAYSRALEQMQLEYQPPDAVAMQLREQCKGLATAAVDKLFKLSRCPAVLERLRQEDRCISIPLQGAADRYALGGVTSRHSFPSVPAGSSSVGLASMQGLRRQLVNVNAQLGAEAEAVGLKLETQVSSSSSILEPSRLSCSSTGGIQQQQLQQGLERLSCPVSISSKPGAAAEAAVEEDSSKAVSLAGKLATDDTCYLVQISSCSA